MNLTILFPKNNIDLAIYFVSLLLGFLLGSIPFGVLIARLKGIDIRSLGSKNIGFTNVYRILGPLYAIPVLVLDMAKGFLPTLFATRLELLPAIVALGTILGHIFTPWLSLKGGKGVATTIGALLALIPVGLLIGIFVFILILLIFSYVSLASICFALSLPIIVAFLYYRNYTLLISIIIISFLIIFRHKSNINRLLNKTEAKFSFRIKRK